jgi:hypothetical protein
MIDTAAIEPGATPCAASGVAMIVASGLWLR